MSGKTVTGRMVTGMAELQAVIKGLKCGSCTTCPYFQIEFCSHAVKRDAIKLIESQQAEIKRLKDKVAMLEADADPLG